MQNILSLEHVIDNNDKLLTIAPREGSQLLGLFHDAHFEKYNFPTIFYGPHPRPSLACSYQKIVQAKLISINKKFTYHISNIFKKTNSFYIILCMDLYLYNKIVRSCFKS